MQDNSQDTTQTNNAASTDYVLTDTVLIPKDGQSQQIGADSLAHDSAISEIRKEQGSLLSGNKSLLINSDSARKNKIVSAPVDTQYKLTWQEAGKAKGNTNQLIIDPDYAASTYSDNDTSSEIYQRFDSVPVFKESLSARQGKEKLFNTHLLIADNYIPRQKFLRESDWMLAVLFVAFFILAWVRVNHNKRLGLIIRAFKSNLITRLIVREGDSLMNVVSLALNIIFILISSLFIFQLSAFYQWSFHSEEVAYFLKIFLLILMIYPIKMLLLKIIGLLFTASEQFNEYIFNVFLMNQILGMLLLPVVIFVAFLSQTHAVLINLGVLIIAGNYVFRLTRGLTIGIMETNISKFYMFLYLCALEILPLIVIGKIFVSYV